MNLGPNIRRRRRALGLTLDALAERSGVSRAMISEIERDAKNPTIQVLVQIAGGLGCTVSELLDERPPCAVEVVRRDERRSLVDPESGARRDQLSPAFARRGVEILAYEAPAGADLGEFPPRRAGTYLHVTVVEGRLAVRVDGRDFDLAAGDSLSFPGNVVYALGNPAAAPGRFFVVVDGVARDGAA